MQIMKDTTKISMVKQTAVAIGKFDGIHLGHQMLLSKVVEEKKNGLMAVVFTFDPPPTAFFSGKEVQELTTKEEKRLLFEQMGIDLLIEFPLTKTTAAMPPQLFIRDILADSLHAKKIIAGQDISFGENGAGNWKLLKSFEKEYQYQSIFLEKVTYEGREISSTYVREEIEKGNLSIANKLLGMPYFISGEVMKGNQIGRTIGMPTVNIAPPNEKLMPPNGVYFSKVKWQETIDGTIKHMVCEGITNIGLKPTVSDRNIKGVETYLYDINKDMYHKEITVELLHFLRPEIKFQNLEELKEQIRKDRETGRIFFENNRDNKC